MMATVVMPTKAERDEWAALADAMARLAPNIDSVKIIRRLLASLEHVEAKRDAMLKSLTKSREAIKPVKDWYQPDDQPDRNLEDYLTDIVTDLQQDRADVLKMQKFKTFVHAYLDQHGVPHGDPENQHQKEGCRIGARLDLMFAERDQAVQDRTSLAKRHGEVVTERNAEREEVLYARDCIKSLRTQLTEAKQERDAKESIIQGMIESAAKLHAERDALRKENARLAGEVDLLNLELRI